MNRASWRLAFPLALLVAVFAATPAFAQGGTRDEGGIGIGVLGGITRDSFRGDAKDFFKTKTGTMFGLWIGGNKNGLIGFTGEFNYLTKKIGVQGSDDELKLQVFEIPAVFHINIGSRSRNGTAVYAVVGPVFSFNLKEKLNDIDVSDDFNGADIGILAGAGIEVYRIGVEVRGNWGLRNISDSGTISDTSNSKAASVEFLAKFRFN